MISHDVAQPFEGRAVRREADIARVKSLVRELHARVVAANVTHEEAAAMLRTMADVLEGIR